MQVFKYVFLFLVFFLAYQLPYSSTFAQQPKTDSLRQQADSVTLARADSLPKRSPFFSWDSLHYRFIGDGNFARGNVNRSLMVLRAEVIYNGPVVSLATNPRFSYGKQNGVLAERDTYVDLFIDIYKNRRVYGFGLGTVERSNLRKIDLRQLAGGGVGLRLVRTDHNLLVLTDAFIYESTDFVERPTVAILRNSLRLKGKHSFFSDKVRFTHITFWQPSLSDISNIRWNTVLSLELPLSSWVTIRSSFENSFESVVEATRKQNDSRLTIGISIGNKH
jgi:hypothetical protein